MKLRIEDLQIQRHNGQNAYGAWLGPDEEDELHGEISVRVYDAVLDEAIEENTNHGHIVVGGQHYDWRLAERL